MGVSLALTRITYSTEFALGFRKSGMVTTAMAGWYASEISNPEIFFPSASASACSLVSTPTRNSLSTLRRHTGSSTHDDTQKVSRSSSGVTISAPSSGTGGFSRNETTDAALAAHAIGLSRHAARIAGSIVIGLLLPPVPLGFGPICPKAPPPDPEAPSKAPRSTSSAAAAAACCAKLGGGFSVDAFGVPVG